MPEQTNSIDYAMEAASGPHFSGLHLDTRPTSSSPLADAIKQPFVIGVSGGTASGKTTVCDMIIQQLHDHRVVLVNQAFDSLLQKLHKYVPIGSSVTDLYAGAGVIGLSLASTRKCRSVRCVEINKESKLAFEKTIDRLPSSLDSSISWHHADTSIEPLSWLVGSDILVVDPPRKGLDPSLIGALRDIKSAERKAMTLESPTFKAKDEKRPWILRAREDSVQIPSRTTQEENRSLPQTLIYISCGWESFKENCMALLSSKAWYLSKAHGFNFFPGTQSIEILAVFKRGPGTSVKKKKSGKKKMKKNKLPQVQS